MVQDDQNCQSRKGRIRAHVIQNLTHQTLRKKHVHEEQRIRGISLKLTCVLSQLEILNYQCEKSNTKPKRDHVNYKF